MCGFIFSTGWGLVGFIILGGLCFEPLAQSAQDAVSGQIRSEDTPAGRICEEAGRAMAAGHLDSAISELESATHRYPKDPQIQFNLGLALSRKGRLEEAIGPLHKAERDPTFSKQAQFLLAANSFESKKYEEAAGELKGMVMTERVLYMLEESQRRSGHVAEAKEAFHELMTRYPDSGWTHYLMGTAYEDQQQFDKALDEYKQALARDATIPNLNFAIGYIYWWQQDSNRARDWLKKETATGCHGLANYYLGEIARSEKDTRQAEAYYRRTLECDASSSEAHLRLAIIFGEQKHYAEAVTQLKAAIRLDPKGTSAHYHLAAVYRAMGRKAEAQLEFGKVREMQAAKENGAGVSTSQR